MDLLLFLMLPTRGFVDVVDVVLIVNDVVAFVVS